MGLLLKIILFGVAVYAVWKTFARWKGLYDRFVGRPEEPARPAPPPAAPRPSSDPQVSARKVVVEDTVQCAGCGAYVPAGAEKCGHCGRPQP
jgi:ribosomal protein L40E